MIQINTQDKQLIDQKKNEITKEKYPPPKTLVTLHITEAVTHIHILQIFHTTASDHHEARALTLESTQKTR